MLLTDIHYKKFFESCFQKLGFDRLLQLFVFMQFSTISEWSRPVDSDCCCSCYLLVIANTF